MLSKFSKEHFFVKISQSPQGGKKGRFIKKSLKCFQDSEWPNELITQDGPADLGYLGQVCSSGRNFVCINKTTLLII